MSGPIAAMIDAAVRCGRCSKSRKDCRCDVRPFANGTEGYDWLEANCERCTKKGEPDAMGVGPCPMESAVSYGFIIGTIPAELAVQFGATINPDAKYCTLPRQCSQFAPLMVCESIKTRNRRRCRKPATTTVTHDGLQRPVCARHERAYLADDESPIQRSGEDEASASLGMKKL